jgi:hypothetical protein
MYLVKPVLRLGKAAEIPLYLHRLIDFSTGTEALVRYKCGEDTGIDRALGYIRPMTCEQKSHLEVLIH